MIKAINTVKELYPEADLAMRIGRLMMMMMTRMLMMTMTMMMITVMTCKQEEKHGQN